MTHLSGISSGAAGSVFVVSAHSFQAAFYPCFQRVVPCHRAVTGRVAVVCGCQGQGGGRFGGVEKKRRQAHSRGSGLLQREGHGGSAGPLPGAASVELVSSFFFYTAPFNSASFPVALGGLTANASLDCLCFAEVFVDKEVRRLISFLYLHLVFVELKGSMPCNSPARFTLLCCCETAAVS